MFDWVGKLVDGFHGAFGLLYTYLKLVLFEFFVNLLFEIWMKKLISRVTTRLLLNMSRVCELSLW
ncbi:hypothetical protein HanPSC8_Chr12g0509051 [Helianthus annuus]|nr:hypothetical protein HanPSC8_Chr12g0509051 [Helianthus annuus]